MRNEFASLCTREDREQYGSQSTFEPDEVINIAQAVQDNPKANLAACISLFSRCAADWRSPQQLSLYQTALPLMPNWGQPSQEDSPEFSEMKAEFSAVMKLNKMRFASAQQEYERAHTHRSRVAFDQAMMQKYGEKARAIAEPIAKAQLQAQAASAQRPYNEHALKSVGDDLLAQEMFKAVFELSAPDRESREQYLNQCSELAFGDLHGANWFEVLADCFERDVLPAFAQHCEFSKPDLFAQTIDRITELTQGESPSMRH